MPLLSCFTPFGMLDFSSDPSDAEKIYNSMVAAHTDPRTGEQAIDLTPGTRAEAKVYATSMAIAGARVTLRAAGNEQTGETSYWMLPAHERRYSISPGATATVAQRRAVLAAHAKLARGPRREAILEGLTAILGEDLLAYRPVGISEASTWPAAPGDGPGIFSRPGMPARVVRLLWPVSKTGAETTVPYENWNPADTEVLLRAGDVLSVQPENLGLAEKITVLAVEGTGSSRTFTAVFARGHDKGSSATTGPMPLWLSTKRFVFVVVKHDVAIDAEKVRRVDELMNRVSRGPTLWAVVRPTTPGASTVGPFTLNVSPAGAVSVGSFTI